ncbi:hypothetical protein GW17_00000901 [Ensete ventricosum]|nr:hypothetical protein GW17_00000901 [Ensete ventricosum]
MEETKGRAFIQRATVQGWVPVGPRRHAGPAGISWAKTFDRRRHSVGPRQPFISARRLHSATWRAPVAIFLCGNARDSRKGDASSMVAGTDGTHVSDDLGRDTTGEESSWREWVAT